MSEGVRTYETEGGHWVVSDGGMWLPGVYDSEETALFAATVEDQILVDLRAVYRIDGENRPVTRADIDAYSR